MEKKTSIRQRLMSLNVGDSEEITAADMNPWNVRVTAYQLKVNKGMCFSVNAPVGAGKSIVTRIS